MAQYISKDALVEEIERRIKSVNSCPFRTAELGSEKSDEGQLNAYNVMLSFINTLEVKEVDLEKVIEEYFKGWTDDYNNGGAACHYQYVQVKDCKAIAKHFFELGLTQKEYINKGESK